MENSTHEVETLEQQILTHTWHSLILAKADNLKTGEYDSSSIKKKSFKTSYLTRKKVPCRNSNNDSRPSQKERLLVDNHTSSSAEVIENRKIVKDTREDSKISTCNRRKHECGVSITSKCMNVCDCVKRLFTVASKKLSKKKKMYYCSTIKEEENDASLKEAGTPLASLKVKKNIKINDCLSFGLNPSYLEKCLKEAITTVLLSLPEEYDLVEHSSSLFVFFLEFISSSPRPDHTQNAVVLAILKAHTTSPCVEDEILALNNPHPALYVALKLCCVRWGRSTTGPVSRRYKGNIYEKSTKNTRILDYNESLYDNKQAEKNSVSNIESKAGSLHKDTDEGECHTTSGRVKIDFNKTEEKVFKNENFLNIKEYNNLQTLNEISFEKKKTLVVNVLTDIQQCERSFKRLMMCLLQESTRAAERGWCCDNESEQDRVQDLRFFLYYAQSVEDCSVSDLVSKPLWVTGSCPVEVAARWGTPGLLLTLLQHGAGASSGHVYSRCPRSHFRKHLWKRCIAKDHLTAKDGVFMAIASLISKLDRQVREESSSEPLSTSYNESRLLLSANKDSSNTFVCSSINNQTDNLLIRAGNSTVGTCLRYLLRAVPHVPAVYLRDHSSECSSGDVASLLPRTACADPPSLCQLARATLRITLRMTATLPQAIYVLQIPYPLKDYLNLLTD